MKRNLLSAVAIIGAVATMTSCSKDDAPSYNVPTTYNFDNVEYKDASARVSMVIGFTGYLGKSNVRQLNQDTVNNLWNNVNRSFTAEVASNIPYLFDALNGLTINLSAKTSDASTFKLYADSMVKISQYQNVSAAQGVAGKIGTRIFNYSGLEFNQLVAKGLMGSLQLANVISILDKIPSDDNNTVTAGVGTAMQHNWDLAFGYVGIPKDYDSAFNYTATPVKADRPLSLGGYFWERARPIKAGGTVFEAFRRGRAAIGAKDYSARDAAIATIKEYLEKTLAASANAYLGLSQTRTEPAARFHDYSEAYGFMLALKYRSSASKLSAASYQSIIDFLKTDFWTLAATEANSQYKKTKEMQAVLTTAYGAL